MVLVADQTREDINFGNNETTKDCVAKVKKKKKKEAIQRSCYVPHLQPLTTTYINSYLISYK